MKTASFHTLGCRLNYTESMTVARQFRERGFTVVEPGQPSDVFVLNTCTVTERADRECRQIIRRVLRNSPGAFVVVTGCYAQLNPGEIAAIGGVDLILGTAEKTRIFDHLPSLSKNPVPQVFVSCIDEEQECSEAFSAGDGTRTRAFLKIQDGCDYTCTFCTIPLARGGSRSLPAETVLARAAGIGNAGYREIVLTGVNVGEYGRGEGGSLLELCRRLERVPSVDRFRISSIEPNLLSDGLIDFILGSGKFCSHFHIPLQSGSDEILGRMQRRYRRARYEKVVDRIASADPDAGIGADVIVGFPGETEEHFRETAGFLDALPVSYLHVFTFSERENTPAVSFGNPVEPRVRFERSDRLRALGREKRASFHRRHVGRTLDVLFEQTSPEGITAGWSSGYARVGVRGDNVPVNSLLPVRVTEAGEEMCLGVGAAHARHTG